jgi:hypothetical protein
VNKDTEKQQEADNVRELMELLQKAQEEQSTMTEQGKKDNEIKMGNFFLLKI